MHPITLPFELVGLVFAAGGFYIFVRGAIVRLAADIARIGQKLRETNERASTMQYRSTIITLATCPAEDREKIAHMLLQGIIGQ